MEVYHIRLQGWKNWLRPSVQKFSFSEDPNAKYVIYVREGNSRMTCLKTAEQFQKDVVHENGLQNGPAVQLALVVLFAGTGNLMNDFGRTLCACWNGKQIRTWGITLFDVPPSDLLQF